MQKRFRTSILITIGYLIFVNVTSGQTASFSQKRDRVEKIKGATVHIFVNGKPNGSGFVISKDGLIATAFHVIFKEYISSEDVQITASPIEVEFNDGTKLPATVHPSCLLKESLNKGTDESFYGDYCILQVTPVKPLEFLQIGSFADAYEGADIYICGYPFDMNKSLVHFGVLSTKATTSYSASGSYFFPKIDGTKTEIAWLDITLNRGNSGGPVVLMGKKPKDDRVIGIVSIIGVPAPPELIEVIKTLNRPQQSSTIESLLNPSKGLKGMSDEDMKKFVNLVGQGLLSSSLGFGACVSIDNLKKNLNQK